MNDKKKEINSYSYSFLLEKALSSFMAYWKGNLFLINFTIIFNYYITLNFFELILM